MAGVFGQLFDASGTAVGSEFQANTSTFEDQRDPSIAALDGDGLIILWEGFGPDEDTFGIYGQRYDASGALANEITITGTAGADVINLGAGDEIAEGLAGDDTLSGGFGNDKLFGGDGDDLVDGGIGGDTLDGGSGIDGVRYANSSSGVAISLAANAGHGGDANGDILVGIENLVGSAHADTLGGDPGANTLTAGDGDDILNGGDSGDLLDGGTGYDTVSYAASTSAVVVNLANGAVSGGHADGDTLINIENLAGSSSGDILTGDGGDNLLSGGPGDDILSGRNGDDELIGGAGDDTLDAGGGTDILYGGSGIDTAVFADSSANYSVSVVDGAVLVVDNDPASAGNEGSNLLENFEVLSFQDGNATITYTPGDPGTVETAGAELQVNSFTENSQDRAAIAGLTDGGYVVTWMSYQDPDGSQGIYAQRYDASGSTAGTEFRVNSATIDGQEFPAITGLADGGFVVTWNSKFGAVISGQRFDFEGNPLGSEFAVSQGSGDLRSQPSITALADGGFVVVWDASSDGDGIHARRFDSDGNPMGGEIKVDTESGLQWHAAVTALPDGGFTVAWNSDDSTDARIFDQFGFPVGDQFQIGATDSQGYPEVATLSNGNLVVSWLANGETTSRLLDSSGNPVGAQFDGGGALAALSGGGFVSVETTNSPVLTAQRYDDSGNPIGSAFQPNTDVNTEKNYPAIVALAGGGFVIGWETSEQDGSARGVFAQQYDITGETSGETTVEGIATGEVLTGTDGDDTLIGGDGNDTIMGGAGDDVIDGGDGFDTAIFAGDMAGYTISVDGAGTITVTDEDPATDGDDGSDTLADIETITFKDGSIGVLSADDGGQLMPEGAPVLVGNADMPNGMQKSVATLTDAGYVVVWYSEVPGDQQEVFGQRYAARRHRGRIDIPG